MLVMPAAGHAQVDQGEVQTDQHINASAVLVINRGKPGSNSSALLNEWLTQTTLQQPRFVVLMVGTNDAVNSRAQVPIDRYKKNLTRMLEHWSTVSAEIKRAEPAILITIPHVNEEPVAERHPDHPQLGSINAHVDTYNATLSELAKTYGATLIDLKDWAAGLGPDGVHMTPAGYADIAQRVAKIIGTRIEPGDRVLCVGDSLTFGSGAQGGGTTRGETYPAVLNNLLNQQVNLPAEARPFPMARDGLQGNNLIYNGDFLDTDDGVRPLSWFFHDFQHAIALQRSADGSSASLLFEPRVTPRNSQPTRIIGRTPRRLQAGQYRLTIQAQAVSNDAAVAVYLLARDTKNQTVELKAAHLSPGRDTKNLHWQPVGEKPVVIDVQLPERVDQTTWQIFVQGSARINHIHWARVGDE